LQWKEGPVAVLASKVHVALEKHVKGQVNMNKRPYCVRAIVLGIITISTTSGLFAQTEPPVSTSIQPFFYPAPPTGFDLVTASDAELKRYGLPKRPAITSNLYTAWVNAIRNAKTRLPNPSARTTNIVHRQKVTATPASTATPGAYNISNATPDYSGNWSGLIANGSYGFFQADGSEVTIAFQPPYIGNENCSDAPYMVSLWGGFDGSSFNGAGQDVLQAGVNVTACSTSYAAWYEWYTPGCTVNSQTQPCYETDVNLAVHAGDYMYIVVTYNASSPHGTAFIENQTTQQYVTVSFDQPSSNAPNSTYTGSTVEWIVERPMVDNNLVDLANYINSNGPSGNQEYLSASYMGADGIGWAAGYGPASTLYLEYMLCPPCNPSSACSTPSQYLSIPTFTNNYLTTYAYGPAVQ